MNNTKTLRYEDAAEPVKIVNAAGEVVAEAWRSLPSGIIYTGHSAEHHARWHDATDIPCPTCDARIGKGYGECGACRQKRRDADWAKRYADAAVDWDGKTPLNVSGSDEFLWDADDVVDYVANNPGDVRLVLCKPDNGIQFDMAEYLVDSLPDDHDLDVREINKTVNDWIAAHAPFSWWPTSTPVRVESVTNLFRARGTDASTPG